MAITWPMAKAIAPQIMSISSKPSPSAQNAMTAASKRKRAEEPKREKGCIAAAILALLLET